MSSLGASEADSSDARWDPVATLELSEGGGSKSVRCKGITTKRARCKYGPMARGDVCGPLEDSKYLYDLVIRLRDLHPTLAAGQNELLLDIAKASVCSRYHQNQAADIASTWKRVLTEEGRRLGPVSEVEARAVDHINDPVVNAAEVVRLTAELEKMKLRSEALEQAKNIAEKEAVEAHGQAKQAGEQVQKAREEARQAGQRAQVAEQEARSTRLQARQAEERVKLTELRVKEKEEDLDARRIRLEHESASVGAQRLRLDAESADVEARRTRLELDSDSMEKSRQQLDDERARIELRRDRLEEQRDNLEQQRSNLESQRRSLTPQRESTPGQSSSMWRRIIRPRRSEAARSNGLEVKLPEVPKTTPGESIEEQNPNARIAIATSIER